MDRHRRPRGRRIRRRRGRATVKGESEVADHEPRRYRFGPIERRGIVGGLRGSQVAIVATALTATGVLLHVSPGAPTAMGAMAIGLLGAALAFYPFGGRTLEQWFPVVSAWTL